MTINGNTQSIILLELQTLKNYFSSFYNEWVILKNKRDFLDIDHHSPIQEMYFEGKSCSYYISQHIDTLQINKTITMSDYIRNLQSSIPDRHQYNSIGKEATNDLEIYKNNYTAIRIGQLYWEQLHYINNVEHLKNKLIEINSSLIYTPPIDIIYKYSKNNWEQFSQLHKNNDENSLRAQLVTELNRNGFFSTAETYNFQGRPDIVVHNQSVNNMNYNLLVAECKFWKGKSHLSDSLSQLCRYITPNDSHAGIIIFVTSGEFNDVCNKSIEILAEHPSCTSTSRKNLDYINYNLIPAQNLSTNIPATMLLCNLTTPRY